MASAYRVFPSAVPHLCITSAHRKMPPREAASFNAEFVLKFSPSGSESPESSAAPSPGRDTAPPQRQPAVAAPQNRAARSAHSPRRRLPGESPAAFLPSSAPSIPAGAVSVPADSSDYSPKIPARSSMTSRRTASSPRFSTRSSPSPPSPLRTPIAISLSSVARNSLLVTSLSS